MSTSYRKQNVPYTMNKTIITCCDCGLQFILEAVIVSEDDGEIQVFDQCGVYYCPYCGKHQETQHD